jgi:HSP20 family protein
MLMRTDPFQALERLTQQWSSPSRTAVLPMDAYRDGDSFVVQLDLPGVDPSSIELNVERDVLSVRAERKPAAGEDCQVLAAERPTGVFTRQVFLGRALDTDGIEASYDAGVLTVQIPVAEQAKPRKISVSAGAADGQKSISA